MCSTLILPSAKISEPARTYPIRLPRGGPAEPQGSRHMKPSNGYVFDDIPPPSKKTKRPIRSQQTCRDRVKAIMSYIVQENSPLGSHEPMYTIRMTVHDPVYNQGVPTESFRTAFLPLHILTCWGSCWSAHRVETRKERWDVDITFSEFLRSVLPISLPIAYKRIISYGQQVARYLVPNGTFFPKISPTCVCSTPRHTTNADSTNTLPTQRPRERVFPGDIEFSPMYATKQCFLSK